MDGFSSNFSIRSQRIFSLIPVVCHYAIIQIRERTYKQFLRPYRSNHPNVQLQNCTHTHINYNYIVFTLSSFQLSYICAQQRRNLNDLIVSRPELGPAVCCRRANNYEKSNFVDSKKILCYEVSRFHSFYHS